MDILLVGVQNRIVINPRIEVSIPYFQSNIQSPGY
jgi:hypothetical protein